MDGNLAGDLSLGDLSDVANLSSRHFLRLFKESTGLSPHQYVVRARVRKARALLVDDDLALGQVAKECGFAHQQHLSRCFNRLVGTSPGRYRKRWRG